jgi:hypothetical protein
VPALHPTPGDCFSWEWEVQSLDIYGVFAYQIRDIIGQYQALFAGGGGGAVDSYLHAESGVQYMFHGIVPSELDEGYDDESEHVGNETGADADDEAAGAHPIVDSPAVDLVQGEPFLPSEGPAADGTTETLLFLEELPGCQRQEGSNQVGIVFITYIYYIYLFLFILIVRVFPT